MPKLNQIIAVKAGVVERADAAVHGAGQALRSGDDAFNGMARHHVYEEGVTDLPAKPDERVQVKVVAEDVLATLAQDLERLFDVTLTLEEADTQARADVVVTRNGKPFVLVPDAPVTYLLFLEKQIARLSQQIINTRLPLHDPATVWEPDGNTGLYRTAQYQTPSKTRRRHNWVKADAIVRDGVAVPAQVEVFEDDTITGHWDTVRYNGALPLQRVRTLVARLDELRRAVITAREEANSIAVTDRKAGAEVFAWLLDK